MTTVYLLTHEYSDKSATHICGITTQRAVAEAWYNGGDETNVYELQLDDKPTRWDEGRQGWQQIAWEQRQRARQTADPGR